MKEITHCVFHGTIVKTASIPCWLSRTRNHCLLIRLPAKKNRPLFYYTSLSWYTFTSHKSPTMILFTITWLSLLHFWWIKIQCRYSWELQYQGLATLMVSQTVCWRSADNFLLSHHLKTQSWKMADLCCHLWERKTDGRSQEESQTNMHCYLLVYNT